MGKWTNLTYDKVLEHMKQFMDRFLSFLEREELLGGGVGMGVRESDTELKAKFDAAIDSMKADGSLNALITKWEIGDTF